MSTVEIQNIPDINIEKLEDLRGKSVQDLTFSDKARIMSQVLPPAMHDVELAEDIVKLRKGSDHKCGKDTCNNTCHYHLKARIFDLLYTEVMK